MWCEGLDVLLCHTAFYFYLDSQYVAFNYLFLTVLMY